MAGDLARLISDGIASPLGDVIESVGRGVAEAQAALDAGSLAATLALYEQGGDAQLARLRDIGYRPTFYALPETQCEMQVSLRVGGSGGPDGSAGAGAVAGSHRSRAALYVTPVDAGFASRYSYGVEAHAKLSFKIVPVPPPSDLENLRPVPSLVGQPLDKAVTALRALELDLAITDDKGALRDADTALGLAVSAQRPSAGALLPLRSVVELVVPSQPAPADSRPVSRPATATAQRAAAGEPRTKPKAPAPAKPPRAKLAPRR